MRLYEANGSSLAELLSAGADAVDYVRTSRAPATLLINCLPRRFGHAATDRQLAYLSASEVEEQIDRDPVAHAAASAILAGVVPSREALLEENERIGELAAEAFETARAEPRQMTRAELVARTGPRRTPKPQLAQADCASEDAVAMQAEPMGRSGRTRWEMRPLMTRALTELMATDARVVYIGEDVEHGGYYRVTEGLRDRFGRRRIFDWPPDEASLIVRALHARAHSQPYQLPALPASSPVSAHAARSSAGQPHVLHHSCKFQPA